TRQNQDGQFEIRASANEGLEVSYVGYASQTVTVSSTSSSLQIRLQENSHSLEEAVVTGYGSQRKKDLTGSVAIVDVDQLKAQPAATAVEALQGKATGVQIVNDGAPCSTPQNNIRGYSTINHNEPRYSIDGVPF